MLESRMNRHQFEQAAKHFRAGRLTLTDFSAQVFPEQHPNVKKQDETASSDHACAPLPSRKIDAHKGDFGRVLLIGGSQTMPGAIGLAAMAALRTGSGLVIVATPRNAAPTVAGFSPCYMTQGFSLDQTVPEEVLELVQNWADVIAIGPGLGTADKTAEMVKQLYQTAAQPMVVDADGLNCLAKSGVDFGAHDGQRILTPHPGEFRRMLEQPVTRREEMEEFATQFAVKEDVTLVLKGHRTLITDGKQSSHNPTGNPGMATGGSGDVLTGMIASLVGQGLAAFDASKTSCFLHGKAGDIAADKLGQVSLISSDLLEFLPAAIMQTHSNTP